MQLVCTISNGRCTEFRGFIRSEIENPANPDEPDTPSGNGNMLVVYFSAEGHTRGP